MRRLSFVFALPVWLGLLSPLFAQQGNRPSGAAGMQMPTGTITGRVVDGANGEGLASATVAVWRLPDSTLATGLVTEPDGRFTIDRLRPGRYYLHVSFVGFASADTGELVLRPGALSAEVGTLRLAADAAQLAEVAIEGERQFMEVQIDRTVFNVADQPLAAGGSAREVLENIPSVEVDADGNVSLRGNPNVAILVNGRPAPVSADFLARFLQQLPAGSIERVEIIPNPSARYEPDGMAGILNIVLKEGTRQPLNGTVTVGADTWTGAEASAALNVRRGSVGFFTSYSLRRDVREPTANSYREDLYLDPVVVTEQFENGERSNLSHLLNSTLEYTLAPHTTLTATGLLSARTSTVEGLVSYYNLDNTTRTLDFDRSQAGDGTGRNGNASLRFDWQPEQGRREVMAEVRYAASTGEDDDLFENTNGSALLEAQRTHTEQDTYDASAQVDVRYPLSETARFETGAKATLRGLGSDLASVSDPTGGGVFTSDPGITNAFTYDEQVYAAYVVGEMKLGLFGVQAGVRAEQALATFDQQTTGEDFDRSRFSLFPSAFVQYTIAEGQTAKIGYSRRINRPRVDQLNPFARYDDPRNVRVGNPDLRPEYIDALEATYTRFTQASTFTLTPYFRRTNDLMRFRRTIDTATGVTTTNNINYDTNDAWGLESIYALRLGQTLNGSANLNVYYSETVSSDFNINRSTLGWRGGLNLSYQLRRGSDLQFGAFYRSGQRVELGRLGGMMMTNVALRQRLLGDRATLSVRLSDVLDSQRFRITLDNAEDFYQENERRWGGRTLAFTFTYQFGQASQDQRRPQRTRDQQPDMGGDMGM